MDGRNLAMNQEIRCADDNSADKVEGKNIILHDVLPEGCQDLKTVVIIKGNKTHRYTIRRTRKGKYLFQ
jgi:hypothetical protein